MMRRSKLLLVLAGLVLALPAYAQNTAPTPSRGPEGTGNYIAGKPEGSGNFVAGKPEGTGNFVAGKPEGTGNPVAGKPVEKK